MLEELLKNAKAAKSSVAALTRAQKDAALLAMADALEARQDAILDANRADLDAAAGKISDVMLDRLRLTPARIAGMAQGMRDVAALPDPVGTLLEEHTRPDGLRISKLAVPMGVVAIIYESRPNVTSDAAALALKSGNVCILRGGKEAFRSADAIVDALRAGLAAAGVTENAVNLVRDTSRAGAQALMTADGYVDLLIPRGGAGLIRACVENATVPCIATGTGICHVYVDAAGDQAKALDIIENAKTSRPSVCNAEEVLLVHSAIAAEFLPKLKCPACARASGTGWSSASIRRRRTSSRAHRRAKKISTRNFSTTSSRSKSSPAWRRPSRTSPPIPPATATPSSRATRRRRPASSSMWTARPSMSTRPPASPTAASSASAAKWASPRRSCTPAARWGCAKCAPINMSSAAADM